MDQVIIVPSVWHEAFGMVALDAMIRGIPTLVSTSGGLPEIVNTDDWNTKRAEYTDRKKSMESPCGNEQSEPNREISRDQMTSLKEKALQDLNLCLPVRPMSLEKVEPIWANREFTEQPDEVIEEWEKSIRYRGFHSTGGVAVLVLNFILTSRNMLFLLIGL